MHGILIPCPFPHLPTCVSISYHNQIASPRGMGCRGRAEMSLVSHRSTPPLIHTEEAAHCSAPRALSQCSKHSESCPAAVALRLCVADSSCLALGKCLQMLMRAWHLQPLSSLLLTYSPRGRCTGHKRQCGDFNNFNVIGTVTGVSKHKFINIKISILTNLLKMIFY